MGLLKLHNCGELSSNSSGVPNKEIIRSKNNLSNNSKILSMFKRKVIKSMDEDTLVLKINNYFTLGKRIKYIDIITTLIDLVTVFFFYNDHFEYIDDNLSINKKSNIFRFVFLISSLFVCILIFYRYKIKIRLNKILVELECKKATSLGQKSKKKKMRMLIFEIVIHILQPYPYLKYSFVMDRVGSPITYSLNMVLYFLCTLRCYLMIKVIRYWNLYSTERSKKILKFFDKNSNSDLFLYKANLDQRGFLTLSCFGIIVLIYFSLLLKVLEYYKYDKSNPFNYYWNSIWYLIVTMGTIGYGDITPKTVVGRIIGVLVCLVGVVVLSLIVVTLTIFTYLDSDELVAYNAINSLSTNYFTKQKIQNYVKRIISARIKYKFKRVDLQCITDKYQLALEKIECNLEMHRQRPTKNIHNEFIGNVREIIESHLDPICEGFQGMWEFEDGLEDYLTSNSNLNDMSRESKNIMLSCLNLAKCLTTVGSIKNLRNITEIQHKKAISTTELRMAKRKYTKRVSNIHSFSATERSKEVEDQQNSNDIVFENNCSGGDQEDTIHKFYKSNEENSKYYEEENKNSSSLSSY